MFQDVMFGTFNLRSGGPKLKSTQSYPMPFCSRIGNLHKTWCIETWAVEISIK